MEKALPVSTAVHYALKKCIQKKRAGLTPLDLEAPHEKHMLLLPLFLYDVYLCADNCVLVCCLVKLC